jgi:hypothetical protein
MLITALALIVVGVLITASALALWSFDFAVAVRPGWHVTVFPPPVSVGVLAILGGIVALLASLFWR